MALSNLTLRERYIAIGTTVAVGLLGLNYFFITPFFERGTEISSQQRSVNRQLLENDVLFKKQHNLQHIWADLSTTGGMKNDPSDAKGQLMQALETWAGESGVIWTNLTSEHTAQGSADIKSEKPEAKFDKIVVRATGSGSMASMAKLLWHVESSPALLKVNEIQLTPRKEATDDLQLQLSVSTVSVNPDADRGNKPNGPGPGGPRSVASAGAKGDQP